MRIVYTNQYLSAFTFVRVDDEDSGHLVSSLFPGVRLLISPRFWKGFWRTCKVSEDLFRYFSGEEIFTRVTSTHGSRIYRFCLEVGPSGHRMLGVSLPGENKTSLELVMKNIRATQTLDSGYHDGLVYAVHPLHLAAPAPRRDDAVSSKHHIPHGGIPHATHRAEPLPVSRVMASTKVEGGGPVDSSVTATHFAAGDPSFLILRRIPIDGIGHGLQTIGVKFGSDFLFFDAPRTTAKNSTEKLDRKVFTKRVKSKSMGHLEFSLEDAVVSRLNAAAISAASLAEVAGFYRLCDKADIPIEPFDQRLGHPFESYGLSSYNAFSATRQSRLPTRVTVLELLEVFAAAARQFNPDVRWRLYAMAGATLTSYFDFEGVGFDQVMELATSAVTQGEVASASVSSGGGTTMVPSQAASSSAVGRAGSPLISETEEIDLSALGKPSDDVVLAPAGEQDSRSGSRQASPANHRKLKIVRP